MSIVKIYGFKQEGEERIVYKRFSKTFKSSMKFYVEILKRHQVSQEHKLF